MRHFLIFTPMNRPYFFFSVGILVIALQGCSRLSQRVLSLPPLAESQQSVSVPSATPADVASSAWGITPLPSPGPLQMQAKVDLDGDGITENISLHRTGQDGMQFMLTVGNVSLESKLSSGAVDGFAIVDVDVHDRWKEIAVHAPGPSNDDEYALYSFRANTLKEMALISRWPFFPGDGTALVDTWMGFWRKRDLYMLDPVRNLLVLRPAEFSMLPLLPAKTRGEIRLRTSRSDDASVLAVAATGSTLRFLVADTSPTSCRSYTDSAIADWNCDWYFLTTESGIAGWTRLGDVLSKLEDLPMAD